MECDLSRLVDALPGLVWTAGSDGGFDFLSQRWLDYTGIGSEEARGRGWEGAIHPDDLAGLLERWQSIQVTRKAGEMEARLRRFDGEYRWFLFRVSPLAEVSGQSISWCGISTDLDERRRAETAKDRFQSIVDGLPAVVTLLAIDGHVEHANRHMLEYLGTRQEEMKGREIGQAFHPEDRPEVLARWAHSTRTGEPYNFEARLRRSDGVYRWFHTRGLPLRDAQGQIFLWYFLQTDVDDRKRAEELLAGEKRLLEMVAAGESRSGILTALCRLIENTAGGCYCSVVLSDASGTRVEYGAAPSLPDTFINSIIGRPINLESGPCGMAAYLNRPVVSNDLTSEERWTTWCPMAMEHGLRSCWSTPITAASGKVLGAFAIYHESPTTPTLLLKGLIEQFTHVARIAVARVQADAALRRSEMLLSKAQHLSSTGSFSWKVATDVVEYSDQTYRTYEFDPNIPVTLELIAGRVHPEDNRLLREMIDLARGPGSDLDFEYRLQMPDGSVRHLHLVAHGTLGWDGQLEYVGAIQDVTQRRLTDEALSKARSELTHVARVTTLGALTASITHEVNQPLSGIITNASTCLRMLAMVPPNVEGALETARRTIRDGHRASEVITRLRTLFTKRSSTLEHVDLNEATREVIALSLGEHQRNRVTCTMEFDEDLPLVAGDRVQLQQVILNLLLNGAEAMRGVERAKELVIKTTREGGDRVQLTVQDVGIGLAPEIVDKLFDAFYTTKDGGMGIGLYVSRSIIQSHNGRLWAASNNGEGATFSFSLPRADAEVVDVS